MDIGFSDRGIVLGTVDYKDTDKIVSLLTEKHGLVRFFARGVRRQGSKKGPHLDLFQLVRFQTQRGNTPIHLLQLETEKFFPNIKSSFEKIKLCLILVEILNNTLAQEVPDLEIFSSFVNYLDALNNSVDVQKDNQLTRKFSLYLLRHLGYPSPTGVNISSYFETIMNRKIIANQIR